jgi:hypothetical protein
MAHRITHVAAWYARRRSHPSARNRRSTAVAASTASAIVSVGRSMATVMANGSW